MLHILRSSGIEISTFRTPKAHSIQANSEASTTTQLVSECERPRHYKVHHPRRQCTLAQDSVPVPLALIPSLQFRTRSGGSATAAAAMGNMMRSSRRLDDVRCNPHLDRAAAARCRADDSPANERPALVVEEREREVRRRPAYCFVCVRMYSNQRALDMGAARGNTYLARQRV
jgi:hypothetical protein